MEREEETSSTPGLGPLEPRAAHRIQQVLLRAPQPETVASVRDCLLGLLDRAAKPAIVPGGKRALPRRKEKPDGH